jgi:hypothetical protein
LDRIDRLFSSGESDESRGIAERDTWRSFRASDTAATLRYAHPSKPRISVDN